MDLKLSKQLTKVMEAFRVWLPTAPQRFRALAEEVKQDPRMVLRSPTVRITLLATSGLVLAMIIYAAGEWFVPSTTMGEPAETVPFRVLCANPKCAWHKARHTVQLEADFNDWPAECPQCKTESLQRVVRCHNTKCRKWVVPNVQPDGSMRCPKCGKPL